MQRTKRSLINALWGFIEKIITLICPFIIRTIIIHKLGNEYLGLSSLMSSVLQVLSLAELGFGDAIIYYMYKPISENNNKKTGEILNTFKIIYRMIGVIILLLGIILIPFLKSIVRGTYPADINLYLLYLLYLANTVISYFMFAYKESLLKANQRNDISSKITALCQVLMYFAQIILLLFFGNYYSYVLAILAATIVINIFSARKVDKLFPEVRCTGRLGKNELAELKKQVLGIALTKVAIVFRNSFDSIVISAFIGLVALAKYQNYYYVVSALSIIVASFVTAMTASIGNSIVKETIEKNLANYKELLFVYCNLSAILMVCMLCAMQDFIFMWVGSENSLPFYIVVLCCAYFYLMRLGDVTAIYRQAAGLWWEDRYRPLIESAANLMINIVLVKRWGIGGVLASTIVSILFINIPWTTIILFKKYFKQNCSFVFKKILIYSLATVVAGTVSYRVCVSIAFDSFLLCFFLKSITAFIITSLFIIAVNYRSPEFKMSQKRIIGIVKKRK